MLSNSAPATSHRRRRPLGSGPPALLLLAVLAGCDSPPTTSPPPPPAPARLQIVAGDAQSGPIGTDLPLPLTVRVTDQAGTPAREQVTFEVLAGGGSLLGSATQTIATTGGIAAVSWHLGLDLEAAQEVRATLTNLPPGEQTPVTFHATAVSLATRIEIVSGDGQTGPADANLPLALTVRTTDAAGNPAGSLVVFEVLEGAGTLPAGSPVRSATSAEGIAGVSWRLGANTASQQSVRASIFGMPVTEPSSVTFRAAVLPGPPRALQLLSPPTATVAEGPSFSEVIQARVLDRFGTPVPGVAVSWRSTSAAGRFDSDVATTDAAGVASNGWTVTPRTGPLLGVYSAEISLTTDDGDLVARVERTAGSGVFVAGSVVAGGAHTCALDPAQEAYCWGKNADGQLGDGSNVSRALASPVAGGHRFVLLAAGNAHTCGIASTGESYCWGNNSSGQLGDGSRTERAAPALVAGGLRFVTLSPGHSHTCGLAEDESVFCWGSNGSAKLGDPSYTTADRLTPGRVPSTLRFAGLAAGGEHTCAGTTDGATYCWGDNGYRQADPQQGGTVTSPTLVEGSYTGLAAGSLSTCGKRATGAVTCWGASVAQPVLISVAPIASITAGDFTTCGLTSAGELFCWAVVVECDYYCYDYSYSFSAPARVDALLPSSSVTIGSSHFCAIARDDQRLYCWGHNYDGQLGNPTVPRGSRPPTATPTPVVVPGRP